VVADCIHVFLLPVVGSIQLSWAFRKGHTVMIVAAA
jgi:hypothetical protein